MGFRAKMVQFVNKLRANKITNITNDFKMDVIIIILILMLMSIFKMTMKTKGCFLFFFTANVQGNGEIR